MVEEGNKGIIELGSPSVKMLLIYFSIFFSFYLLNDLIPSQISLNLILLGGILFLFEAGRMMKEIIVRFRASDALVQIYFEIKSLEIGAEYSLEFPDDLGLQYEKITLRRVM